MISTVQLTGSGSFDSQMTKYTVTGKMGVSSGMEFQNIYLINNANMVKLIMGSTRKEPSNQNGTTEIIMHRINMTWNINM